MNKGQYFRLLLSTSANPTKVVAAAKELQLHFSAQTEDSSTKDTTSNWLEYLVTAMSYDITGSAMMLTPDDTLGGNTANTLNDFIQNLKDDVLYWKICLMEGENNRTVVQEVVGGQCKLTQLQMTGQNKQGATYQYTLNGYSNPTIPQPQTQQNASPKSASTNTGSKQ